MLSKITLAICIMAMLIIAVFPAVLQSHTRIPAEVYAKIDPNLWAQMQSEAGPYIAMVKVKWNPDLEPIKFQHDTVIAELKKEAAETQAPVIAYLKQKRDAEILNTFWLCNYILVKAEESTIRELATFTTVERVIMNFRITLPENEAFEYASPSEGESATATWNVEKIRAPEVWEVLGLTGEGIKFATTDTGLDITHQDLADTLFTADPTDPKYPGGWIEFDSYGNPVWSTPHDTYGHGTATYGLIVGQDKGPFGHVGVAPGAKGLGMHALTLPGGSGTFAQVLAGLQWVIDPFDEAGNHYPPARVSSHSWGATGYYCELVEAVENMYWAGHLCIASIGNSYEGSSGTPGNYYSVFGVGATDVNDYVAAWSSGEWVYKTDFPCTLPDWWPEKWIKPDVSAPGVDCVCPYPGNQYVYWSGTSFSSPHVAGAAILLLSGNPSLTPDEIKEALKVTSVWYDRYYPTRPDTRYGWGRIDAFEAAMMVALPQGIRGYVTDATTGAPIYKAKVYCHEMDRTVYTNEDGYYDMRLLPGTYTITVSRFGYEEQTITGVKVVENQFTWLNVALTPLPPGYLEGYVYFKPTNIGIPGALVEALNVPMPVQVETDADGHFVLAIPPGTYDFKASAYGFKEDIVKDVEIVEGQTTFVNFYLTQPPKVAVVGDYPSKDGKITAFLRDKGYIVDTYTTMASVIPYVAEYQCIVLNAPRYYGTSTYSDMANFISATDSAGVGVIWLDSWWSSTAGYELWYYSYYYGLPIGFSFYRYTNYYYGSYPNVYNYYKVAREDSDILDAWPVGAIIPHDIGGVWHDSAYYYMYTPESDTLRYLATLGFYYYGSYYDYYTGIIKYTRTNNKWVILTAHAETPWVDIGGFSDDSKAIFMNSINWASKAAVPHAKFVVWGLKAEPKVGLWKDPRTITVGIKNVGWVEGTDKIEMYVDTTLEGTATVTLAPGEHAYLSWTVSRFDVGTYKVTVRHLTTTFIVRPPQITVQAYEYCTSTPLAGADVYGYYRKYLAPGWFEQWSYTYGGYGHSQFAQPVGDIDGDGINEVIVGGYESLGNGRCRILSYDAAAGTYKEEYSWTHGGGTYNSPSGATILDLDGDGTLELVVSWAYSGSNDGVWAYKWDGTTLTPLDHWYGGFVFDVYSDDIDGDGLKEVLVANAPWGVTYAHVVVLGWQDGHFVQKTSWIHPSYTSYECMMLWTGDVDVDGQIEIVVSLADSYYANGGTWALNWDPVTNTWTYTLVYMDLINGGTHYGVVCGDVNGNGIPEIGIGNNPPGYTGAGAVLVEWDPTIGTYKKVWEKVWSTEYGVIEAVAIGDADNDGENEFVVGGGYIHIIGWDGTKYYEEATITRTSGMLAGTIIGDCDSDGKNEIKACDIIGYGPGKEWIFKYAAEPTPSPTWEFKYFGKTDADGKLTFNSPASVVEMYLFVYKGEKSALGYQYLLEKDLYIEDDKSVTYTPHKNTEAIIVSNLKSTYLDLFVYQHLGITWLQKGALPILWPFIGVKCNPAKIVVTPATYTIRHTLNINDAYGAWWYYFMAPDRVVTVNKKQTYSYYWAGPIQGYIEMTQAGNIVNISWDATDSCGHHITGVTLIEANWLTSTSETSTIPIPIKPGILEDVEADVAKTLEHYPNIALYTYEGLKRVLVKSGYVKWEEKQFSITVDKKIKYVVLSFLSGPYGNPYGPMYVTVIAKDYA
ncbi:MAG: S8 family serine peptidase [Candidatus Bathyarchaeia archaeon]